MTSKSRPAGESVTSVFPFGSRWALPMNGAKKDSRAGSWYSQTMVPLDRSISMTRLNGTSQCGRKTPLSKTRKLPFSSSVGQCCCETTPGSLRQMISPVSRLMTITADAERRLARMLPSLVGSTLLISG